MIVHLPDDGIWVNTDHVVWWGHTYREVRLTTGMRLIVTQDSINRLIAAMCPTIQVTHEPTKLP